MTMTIIITIIRRRGHTFNLHAIVILQHDAQAMRSSSSYLNVLQWQLVKILLLYIPFLILKAYLDDRPRETVYMYKEQQMMMIRQKDEGHHIHKGKSSTRYEQDTNMTPYIRYIYRGIPT